MPTAAAKPKATNTASTAISVRHSAKWPIACAPPSPTAIPSTPPISDSVTASTRNWVRMSRRRAPTAIRSPISRVRSLTETSMMFMILLRLDGVVGIAHLEIVPRAQLKAGGSAKEVANRAFGFRTILALPTLHGDHPDRPSLRRDPAEKLSARRRQRDHHDVVPSRATSLGSYVEGRDG